MVPKITWKLSLHRNEIYAPNHLAQLGAYEMRATKVNLLPNVNILKCKSDPRIGVHSIDEIVDLSVVLPPVALVRLLDKKSHRDHKKK